MLGVRQHTTPISVQQVRCKCEDTTVHTQLECARRTDRKMKMRPRDVSAKL